jgi:hypothetical protein
VETTLEVEVLREAICIITIVTDDDGDLKILRIEEFVDSKIHIEVLQALEEANPQ